MLTRGNNAFKQLMLQNNLLILVVVPTNVISIPDTSIALVFTGNPSKVDNIYVASPISSAHSTVCFYIKTQLLNNMHTSVLFETIVMLALKLSIMALIMYTGILQFLIQQILITITMILFKLLTRSWIAIFRKNGQA